MLTKEQKITLETIFSSGVEDAATWGGGTALSEIYLRHRRSEDTDIILSDLPAGDILTTLSNQIAEKIGARSKKSVTKMNRFQYVFELSDKKQQKLEFIYYPFPKLGRIKKIDQIKVESLFDIAVSKTLTAYQRREVKDAFDLYIILSNKHFTLDRLIAGVEKKFGEIIDTAALLAKISSTLDNYVKLTPLIISKKYSKENMLEFFQKELEQFLMRNKL